MARLSKGVDTSKLPSASELIALSTTPGAGEGVEKLASGVTSGLDLADRLATRKLEREKAMLEMQETIRKAKAEADQQKREQTLAQEIGGTSPAATRVAANIGGQPIMAKETRQFQEQAPQRLRAALGAVDPTKTAQEDISRGAAETAATTEFGRKKALSTQDFEEAAELERIKAGLKDKTGKKGLSALLERQTFSLQKGTGLLDEIKSSVAKMSTRGGLVGGAEAIKTRVQQAGRGFLGGKPEVLSFETLRPTAGKALYKDISGDVGNISDSEGKMAADLIPSAYDAPNVRTEKIARLERLQQQSRESITKLAQLAEVRGWDEKQYEEAVKSTIFSHILEASVQTRPSLDSLVEGE